MPTAPFLNPERDDRFARGRPKTGSTVYYTVPGIGIQAGNNQVTTADNDYYQPWFTDTPIIVDQMAVNVAAVNSGTVARIGFYRADRNWQPTGAPLADSGDLTTSTTGVKTYTPGTPIYVPRGRYLSVLNSDTGTTSFMAVSSTFSAYSDTLSSGIIAYWRVSRAYAAFPTPGTPWDTITVALSFTPMFVFYRVSTP